MTHLKWPQKNPQWTELSFDSLLILSTAHRLPRTGYSTDNSNMPNHSLRFPSQSPIYSTSSIPYSTKRESQPPVPLDDIWSPLLYHPKSKSGPFPGCQMVEPLGIWAKWEVIGTMPLKGIAGLWSLSLSLLPGSKCKQFPPPHVPAVIWPPYQRPENGADQSWTGTSRTMN